MVHNSRGWSPAVELCRPPALNYTMMPPLCVSLCLNNKLKFYTKFSLDFARTALNTLDSVLNISNKDTLIPLFQEDILRVAKFEKRSQVKDMTLIFLLITLITYECE